MRELRKKFLDLRSEYRDQYKSRLDPIPLRDLSKVPPPPAPKIPRTPKPRKEVLRGPKAPVPFKERRTHREERVAQEERVRKACANKGKQKGS
jgi:hypothetical protein